MSSQLSPLDSLSASLKFSKANWIRFVTFILLLGLFSISYLKIAELLVAQTNITDKNLFGGDQMHNMRLATQTRDSRLVDPTAEIGQTLLQWVPHRTDGVVQPLWPWLTSWLVSPNLIITEEHMLSKTGRPEDYAFFHQGRLLNIGITLGFLLILGLCIYRHFSLLGTLNVLLLGGFAALLPRAVYFQPEPIYFILFFLTWVTCILSLRKNTLWLYGAIGLFSGLAYLTKSSVHPLLLGFIITSSLRWLIEVLKKPSTAPYSESNSKWRARSHIIGLLILALTHFLVISPRLTYSQERYGDAFHSFPSYWMWMDDFDKTGYTWMHEHNTKEKLQNLDANSKPSLRNYLKNHTTEQSTQRLLQGSKAKLMEFVQPKQTDRAKKKSKQKPWRGIFESRGYYLFSLFSALGLILICIARLSPQYHSSHYRLIQPETFYIIFFVVGSCVGYTLLYGWYHPIGRGDRFMMSLYLPLAFTLIWAMERAIHFFRQRQGPTWFNRFYQLLQAGLCCALCWRLWEIFKHPYFYNN